MLKICFFVYKLLPVPVIIRLLLVKELLAFGNNCYWLSESAQSCCIFPEVRNRNEELDYPRLSLISQCQRHLAG